ncbi:MAG: hypothetical protein J6B67_03655 [Oscillospiraceae bacterium]|nr:hypothetical protein [Oscillospiraceae bacterium]
MKFFDNIKNNIQSFRQKIKANPEESLFRMICMWVYKLRSVFLAVPVAFAAVLLALDNLIKLPEKVELCMPAGEGLAVQIIELNKLVAVFGPLVITALCLVMVFCSRRVAYPWLISVFSLVLPLFIYFASVFPG